MVGVGGAYHGEVSLVQCGNIRLAESFGQGNDRSVRAAKRQVSIGFDQLRNAL